MEVYMVRNKSTRWDCDVKLWRGIPCSIPSFYGWKNIDNPLRGQDPSDTRFYACHHCNTFVPESEVPGHSCWNVSTDVTTSKYDTTALDEGVSETTPSGVLDHGFSTHWGDANEDEEESTEEPPCFVEITDEVEEIHNNGKCFLCSDRMKMEYKQDLEFWVYKDCVLVLNRVVHKECYMIVRDNMTEENFIQYSNEQISRGKKELELLKSDFDY